MVCVAPETARWNLRLAQAQLSLALTRGALRGLTFELSGRQRQDARPGLTKMYRVPPDWAWWPAVGAPLERRVRAHWRGAAVDLNFIPLILAVPQRPGKSSRGTTRLRRLQQLCLALRALLRDLAGAPEAKYLWWSADGYGKSSCCCRLRRRPRVF